MTTPKYDADDEDKDMDPASSPADNAEALQQAEYERHFRLDAITSTLRSRSAIRRNSGQGAAEDDEHTSGDESSSHNSHELEGIANNTSVGNDHG